jgi:3'-phosphoadenosine 5'-phosphosulfate sulfotransferase (PAPS reductase)/FAD synthetase
VSRISKSLSIIKTALRLKPDSTPLIINFSGGKDSSVIVHLARRLTDEIHCLYVDGGIDLPGTLEYVRGRAADLNVKLHIVRTGINVKVSHKPGYPLEGCQTFADYVKKYKYWPTAYRRWCSTWLKHRPMKAYLIKEFGRVPLYKLCGVRQFESRTRLEKYGNPENFMRFAINGNKFFRPDAEHRPAVLVYPILEWTTADIYNYIRTNRIQLHYGYNKFGVSGCKWCPVHKPEIYLKVMDLFPGIYEDIIALEKLIGKPSVQNKLWLKDYKKWNLKRKE